MKSPLERALRGVENRDGIGGRRGGHRRTDARWVTGAPRDAHDHLGGPMEGYGANRAGDGGEHGVCGV